jgi:hypothetical protein
MDANNTTTLLDAGNADSPTQLFLVTLGLFAASWIVLCAVMYFIAPYFGKFADLRSRIVYSAVYSLPFAIIVTLGNFMPKSLSLESVLLMLLIVIVMVMLQSLLLGILISKDIIKKESKRPAPGSVNGKRNVKGRRK